MSKHDDWLSRGKFLRASFQQRVLEHVGTVVSRSGAAEGPVPGISILFGERQENPEFLMAYWPFLFSDDPSSLMEYLRSDKPLGNPERCALAKLFERKSEESQIGRPQDTLLRTAATAACHFYDLWRRDNKSKGISDRGHGAKMKDYAALAMVEDAFAWQFLDRDIEGFVEAVRELMDRPKHRRDPGEHSYITIPVSPDVLKRRQKS
jgi:hypothetical protein